MIDIVKQINATHREIGDQAVATGEGRSLLLRRSYDAPIEDVWSACTDPERISRWPAPIDGALRLGGTFQLKGNAGGEILRCEEPRLLKLTGFSARAWSPSSKSASRATTTAAPSWSWSELAAAIAFGVRHFAPEPTDDGDG